MERCLRNYGEAMRKKPRSTRRPSERSERLDLLVRCIKMRIIVRMSILPTAGGRNAPLV